MALVLPIMIVIVCGFVGMMLELRAENEFQTAVDLAAQAALVPPLGDQAASQADSAYAFSHTLNPSGSESGYLTVTTPISCAGPYLEGVIDLNAQGVPAPVTCTAQADLNFSQTPISIFWFWSIQLSATADAYPPQYRQCQTTSGSTSPLQC
jgi:Flp pilus assembly protein TadG